MLKNLSVQSEYELVLLEEDLVPQDHLLRKIQAILDTEFIRERTRKHYSKKGRPAIDPVVLVKIELIAYLYGIRSDRRLVEEIRVNVAYRWFLGLNLTSPVPHFTTPGKNYTRRWKDSGIFEELFDHVVMQAVNAGYIDGEILFSDSSHLKANANKRRLAKPTTQGATSEMIAEAREKHLAAQQVTYDPAEDVYPCSEKNQLEYTTTTRDGYMVYRSKAAICSQCPRLAECIRSAKHQKVIHRHLNEHVREAVRAFFKTETGQYLAQRRRKTVERSFADKELHGLRHARYRGRRRVQHQCLMSPIAQNLKKLALLESRRFSCSLAVL